jgi:hypothetical protein
MKNFFRDNGLTLFFMALFLASLFGQAFTGLTVHNQDRLEHGGIPEGILAYLVSGHFLEATLENWESEFLQMFAFVLATAYLFQRGSAESNDPDAAESPHPVHRFSPWPVRKGGWMRKAYGHSLSIAFLLCFLASFWLHAVGGAREYNEELLEHGGGPLVSAWGFMGTAQFWFESFQNWQSEFLSVAAVVVFSIYLREKGSSQSKPVESSHAKTGTE